VKDALLIMQPGGVVFDLTAELAAGFFVFFAGGLDGELVAFLPGEDLAFAGFDDASDGAVVPFEGLAELVAGEPASTS